MVIFQVDPRGQNTQEYTPLSRRMQLSFRRATSSVRIRGIASIGISYERIICDLNYSAYYVETPKEQSETVKMSFSPKVVDYMVLHRSSRYIHQYLGDNEKTWSTRRFLRKRESVTEKEDEEAVAENNSLKSTQHITGNYFRLSAFVVDPSTPFHYKQDTNKLIKPTQYA
ncbi:hypothetical protein PGB90_010325 [Kerria lacca]